MSAKQYNQYQNPLLERYASDEMAYIFSPQFKFSTWRKLWVALAECEKDLGLPVTDEQIAEMKAHINEIDFEKAKAHERQTRHDVMAHVYTFGECCPKAKPIIHLGATSAYVGDNTDLIQMRDGAKVLLSRIAGVIRVLSEFATKNASVATLGFTHFQAAQLTTVGKRATLWINELIMDFEALELFIEKVPFLGVKGTTGTQASFLSLFEGNHEKVRQLDKNVTAVMGFQKYVPVSGQTYSRKIDSQIAAILSGIAQTLHKIANDIRLLQHLKEIEEPFEKSQIGSSAMAYKRNPMRSERMTSLCRYIISLCQSPAMTAAEQWFERTLDDSANKRLSIPEMFLAADASLLLALNICDGLVVYPNVIMRHIQEELPFMATENILMACVKRGGDRQELHEQIRKHSMDAAKVVKDEGKPNDLLKRIASDPVFSLSESELEKIVNVDDFTGRAPQQVVEFIKEYVEPILLKMKSITAASQVELHV
jgi:adenylosuccinate lyase